MKYPPLTFLCISFNKGLTAKDFFKTDPLSRIFNHPKNRILIPKPISTEYELE